MRLRKTEEVLRSYYDNGLPILTLLRRHGDSSSLGYENKPVRALLVPAVRPPNHIFAYSFGRGK